MSQEIGDGTLAAADGYLVYDEIHNQLCDIFYGKAGIDDPNSYISKYMRNRYGLDYLDARKLFRDDDDTYTKEAKAAFEADVRSGRIKIVVETPNGDVQVLNIDQFNHDYNKPAGEKTTEGKEVFNGVVTVNQGENVLIVEGSNKSKNPSDWLENFEMVDNFSDSGSTPGVYKDGYKYYKDYNSSVGPDGKITKIVGNSQGGGTAVYIGMQDPSVDVLAVNPAPQYSKDVDPNGNYSNITIVYASGDPLYNLTSGVGFTTEIPGANIVYVDFGLNKMFSSPEIASADIHAAHTGSVSAVDYNEDGQIDEVEKNLGLEIDDVIPRSAFTGKELGSNYKNDKGIVMSSEHMNNFAEYIRILREQDLAEIIDRNDTAYSRNEEKIDNKDYEKMNTVTNLDDNMHSILGDFSKVVAIYLGFSEALVNGLSFAVSSALLGTNGYILPKTESFLHGVESLIGSYDEDLKSIGRNKVNNFNLITSSSSFFEDISGMIENVLNKNLKRELVDHGGDYAIGYTLREVLNTLNEESVKIGNASIGLEECSRYIGERFENIDKSIAEGIEKRYLSNSLSDAEELTYETHSKYLESINLTDEMSVLNQFNKLVDLCCEEVVEIFNEVFKHVIAIADIILSNKNAIADIAEYSAVIYELENAKASTGEIVLDTIVGNTNIYEGINDAVAETVILFINNVVRPADGMIDMVQGYMAEIEAVLSNIDQFSSGLISYLEPHIETLMYDTADLDVVRDTVTLNNQVMSRIDTELISANETLCGQVEFLGKDDLQELTKELQIRVQALNKLHCDIFGDVPMDKRVGEYGYRL